MTYSKLVKNFKNLYFFSLFKLTTKLNGNYYYLASEMENGIYPFLIMIG